MGEMADSTETKKASDRYRLYMVASAMKSGEFETDYIFKALKSMDRKAPLSGLHSDAELRDIVANAATDGKATPPLGVTSAKQAVAAIIPQIISGPELEGMDLPDPVFTIDSILTTGLTILAGKPKKKKSWFALMALLAIAQGGCVLGSQQYACKCGPVLYLALEDNDRRLQKRLRMMMLGQPFPENFHYVTEWPRLDKGGADMLREWIDFNGFILVAIDTWAKIRPAAGGRNVDAYERDYTEASTVKRIADEHQIPVLIVTHQRKASADDIYDSVSGTLGLTGAADATFILADGKHCDGILYGTGRDIEPVEIAMAWDPVTGLWRALGDPREVAMSTERKAIVALLRQAGEPMGPKAIAEALGKNLETTKTTIRRMTNDGILKPLDRGKYICV